MNNKKRYANFQYEYEEPPRRSSWFNPLTVGAGIGLAGLGTIGGLAALGSKARAVANAKSKLSKAISALPLQASVASAPVPFTSARQVSLSSTPKTSAPVSKAPVFFTPASQASGASASARQVSLSSTPGASAPVPRAPVPFTPAPQAPVAPAPQAPVASAPQAPVASAPQAPVAPAPQTPVASAPVAPNPNATASKNGGLLNRILGKSASNSKAAKSNKQGFLGGILGKFFPQSPSKGIVNNPAYYPVMPIQSSNGRGIVIRPTPSSLQTPLFSPVSSSNANPRKGRPPRFPVRFNKSIKDNLVNFNYYPYGGYPPYPPYPPYPYYQKKKEGGGVLPWVVGGLAAAGAGYGLYKLRHKLGTIGNVFRSMGTAVGDAASTPPPQSQTVGKTPSSVKSPPSPATNPQIIEVKAQPIVETKSVSPDLATAAGKLSKRANEEIAMTNSQLNTAASNSPRLNTLGGTTWQTTPLLPPGQPSPPPPTGQLPPPPPPPGQPSPPPVPDKTPEMAKVVSTGGLEKRINKLREEITKLQKYIEEKSNSPGAQQSPSAKGWLTRNRKTLEEKQRELETLLRQQTNFNKSLKRANFSNLLIKDSPVDVPPSVAAAKLYINTKEKELKNKFLRSLGTVHPLTLSTNTL